MPHGYLGSMRTLIFVAGFLLWLPLPCGFLLGVRGGPDLDDGEFPVRAGESILFPGANRISSSLSSSHCASVRFRSGIRWSSNIRLRGSSGRAVASGVAAVSGGMDSIVLDLVA